MEGVKAENLLHVTLPDMYTGHDLLRMHDHLHMLVRRFEHAVKLADRLSNYLLDQEIPDAAVVQVHCEKLAELLVITPELAHLFMHGHIRSLDREARDAFWNVGPHSLTSFDHALVRSRARSNSSFRKKRHKKEAVQQKQVEEASVGVTI